MKKAITLLTSLLCAMAISSSFAYAQEEADYSKIIRNPEQPAGTVNCFDYYVFDSIKMNFNPVGGKNWFTNKERMVFQGTITNENDYPIVDGQVFVRVGAKNQSYATEGNFPIDEFIAIDNINLNSQEEKPVEFTWMVPAEAVGGAYQMDFFFTSGKKFNLSGLDFSNEIFGSTLFFEIKTDNAYAISFDRSKTKINGGDYKHIGDPFIISSGAPVKIEQAINNKFKENKAVSVQYDLFWWDSLNDQNKITTKTDKYVLKGGESKTLVYYLDKMADSVYYLKMTATYDTDQKSIINIKLVSDQEHARLNYAGLTKFPLEKGSSGAVFSCFHNAAKKSTNGKVEISLTDKNGNQISKASYSGKIIGGMMAVKNDFNAKGNYEWVKLSAKITDNSGKEIDKYETVYDCNLMKSEACQKVIEKEISKTKNLKTITIIIIIILVVSAGYYIWKRIKNYRIYFSRVWILFFLMTAGLLISGNKAEAYSDFSVPSYGFNNMMFTSQAKPIGGISMTGCDGAGLEYFLGSSGLFNFVGMNQNISCSISNSVATCRTIKNVGDLTFNYIGFGGYSTVGDWEGTPLWNIPQRFTSNESTGVAYALVLGVPPKLVNQNWNDLKDSWVNSFISSLPTDLQPAATQFRQNLKDAISANTTNQVTITSSNDSAIHCGSDLKCTVNPSYASSGEVSVNITLNVPEVWDLVLAGKICYNVSKSSLLLTNFLNKFDKKTFTYKVTVDYGTNPQCSLSVSKAGDGDLLVSTSDTKLNCGSKCTAAYDAGSTNKVDIAADNLANQLVSWSVRDVSGSLLQNGTSHSPSVTMGSGNNCNRYLTVEAKKIASPCGNGVCDNGETCQTCPNDCSCALPVVVLSSNPMDVLSGDSSTITWQTSANVTGCWSDGDWSSGYRDARGGSKLITNITSRKTFKITCWDAPGNTSDSTAYVGIIDVPPPKKPTASIWVSTNPVTYDSGSAIYWSSTNATRCESKNEFGDIDKWPFGNGNQATSGSGGTGSLIKDTTFSVRCCIGLLDCSNWSSVTVKVNQPGAPSVLLTADPQTINTGYNSHVYWLGSSNAVSCCLRNQDANGSEHLEVFPSSNDGCFGSKGGGLTGPINTSLTFYAKCNNVAGVWSNEVNVKVDVCGGISAGLDANPEIVIPGGSSTLSWTTQDNVDSCWGWGNGWDGWKSASGGSENTGPIQETSTYYLECWDKCGNSTGVQEKTVVVDKMNCGVATVVGYSAGSCQVTLHSPVICDAGNTNCHVGKNQPFQADVILCNNGTFIWNTTSCSNGGYKAGDWLSAYSGASKWGSGRLFMPAGTTVPSGTSQVFTGTLTTPNVDGTYDFAFAPVLEDKYYGYGCGRWFSVNVCPVIPIKVADVAPICFASDPPQIDYSACTKCAYRIRYCKADNSDWDAWSACLDEGVCTPGEVSTNGCSGGNKTCNSSCVWGDCFKAPSWKEVSPD